MRKVDRMSASSSHRQPGAATAGALVLASAARPVGEIVPLPPSAREQLMALVARIPSDVRRVAGALKQMFLGYPLEAFVGQALGQTSSSLAGSGRTHRVAHSFFVGPELLSRASLANKADSLSIDRGAYVRDIQRTACLSWFVDRLRRKEVCTALAHGAESGGRVLHCFMESVSFDETPMSIRMPDTSDLSQADFGGAISSHNKGVGAAFPADQGATITKMLQTRSEWGCLATCTAPGGEQHRIIVIGCVANHLQAMKSTSAACVAQALLETDAAGLAENRFGTTSRFATVDRHGSNQLAEQHIGRLRGASWKNAVLPCDVHKIATIHSKSVFPVEGAVRGMLHLALSLSTAGVMAEFRDCLRVVVRDRIVVRVGAPSEEAVAFRKLALRAFIPGGGNATLRHSLLHFLPNGDWRDHKRVVVFSPPGAAEDRGETAARVANSLVAALAHRRFRIYARSKWTGAEEAICDLGIVHFCHGLLAPTFALWCSRLSRRRSQALAAHLRASHDGGADSGDEAAVPAHAAASVHDASGVSALLAHDGEPDLGPDGVEAMSYAEKHAIHRREALCWLGSVEISVGGQLVIIRNLIAPLQQQMRRQLQMSSVAWEVAQQSAAAAATPREGELRRDFRILVAARGTLEHSTQQRIQTLMFNEKIWHLMPESDFTNIARASAFVALSRAGALLESLVSRVHRTYPYKLFLVLEQPSLATAIASDKRCLMDPWSLSFVESEDLGSELARMKLLLHATLAQTDISRVEVGHSSIRRNIKSRVQTQQTDMKFVSSLWMGKHFRHESDSALSAAAGVACPSQQGQEAAAAAAIAPKAAQQRRRGGGPWRAFVREQRSNDLKRVGRLYNALPEDSEVKRRCVEVGREATRMQRERVGTSFGPSSRQAVRLNEKRLNEARLARVQAQTAQHDVQTLVEESVALGRNLPATLRLARQLDRCKAGAARAASREHLDVVRRFAAEHTGAVVETAIRCAPRLAPIKHCLRALPCGLDACLLQVAPHTVCHDTEVLMQCLSQLPSKASLLPSLDAQWGHLHRLLEGEVAPLRTESPISPCHKAGVCLCSEAGRELFRFRNAFLKHMKPTFVRQEGQKRRLLQDGRIVIKLLPAPKHDPDNADLSLMWGLVPQYWHVSAMSFSPYEPTLQEMTECDTTDLDDARPIEGEIALKVVFVGVGILLNVFCWPSRHRFPDPKQVLLSPIVVCCVCALRTCSPIPRLPASGTPCMMRWRGSSASWHGAWNSMRC